MKSRHHDHAIDMQYFRQCSVGFALAKYQLMFYSSAELKTATVTSLFHSSSITFDIFGYPKFRLTLLVNVVFLGARKKNETKTDCFAPTFRVSQIKFIYVDKSRTVRKPSKHTHIRCESDTNAQASLPFFRWVQLFSSLLPNSTPFHSTRFVGIFLAHFHSVPARFRSIVFRIVFQFQWEWRHANFVILEPTKTYRLHRESAN